MELITPITNFLIWFLFFKKGLEPSVENSSTDLPQLLELPFLDPVTVDISPPSLTGLLSTADSSPPSLTELLLTADSSPPSLPEFTSKADETGSVSITYPPSCSAQVTGNFNFKYGEAWFEFNKFVNRILLSKKSFTFYRICFGVTDVNSSIVGA